MGSLENFKQRLFHIRRCILGRDVWVRPTRRFKVNQVGSGDGAWVLRGDLLSPQSIVYSFGLGWDISFDLGLIEQYGGQVFGFEPLPEALRDLEKKSLPNNFRLFPYGIGPTDGLVHFHYEKAGVYASLCPADEETKGFDAEIRKLGTIMRSLGHDRIDVLKMDIEGAEFSVVDDICAHAGSIGQLLIEWHQRLIPEGTSKLREALSKLEQHFSLYYVSPRGWEHSYVSRQIAGD